MPKFLSMSACNLYKAMYDLGCKGIMEESLEIIECFMAYGFPNTSFCMHVGDYQFKRDAVNNKDIMFINVNLLCNYEALIVNSIMVAVEFNTCDNIVVKTTQGKILSQHKYDPQFGSCEPF